MTGTALLLIDIQNDFLPGGALPVPDGDAVIPIANQLQSKFSCIVATQDWHPGQHASFAANHPGKRLGQVIELDGLSQILWPTHCVQHSYGADFPAGLHRDRWQHIVQKGTDPRIDSYSGFFDNGHRKATGLENFLRAENVQGLCILGLATDYCVLYSVLDARRMGFSVQVITDGCRGVGLNADDIPRAWDAMLKSGARLTTSHDVQVDS